MSHLPQFERRSSEQDDGTLPRRANPFRRNAFAMLIPSALASGNQIVRASLRKRPAELQRVDDVRVAQVSFNSSKQIQVVWRCLAAVATLAEPHRHVVNSRQHSQC